MTRRASRPSVLPLVLITLAGLTAYSLTAQAATKKGDTQDSIRAKKPVPRLAGRCRDSRAYRIK